MTWRSSDTGGPRRIREGLDRLVRQYGMPSSTGVAAVFDRWEELVGPGLAVHCTPLRLEADRLVVEASDAAWATQLRLMQNEVLAAVNAHLGDDETLVGLEVRLRRR